jgi:hypothetical protein
VKIRITRAAAEFTVRGTIGRGPHLAYGRNLEHTMTAEEFTATVRPWADGDGPARWSVATLTIEGRAVDGRRITPAWQARGFYSPLEVPDADTPAWLLDLARACLPAQDAPAVPVRPFTIHATTAQEQPR